jgi:hypothetical protein
MYVGEQFLNFIMHADVRPYAGVDLILYFPEELTAESSKNKGKRTLWEHWGRCGMCFKSSLYNAGQAMLFTEEKIQGTPLDKTNIFFYDILMLNLPGWPDYNPSKPWVFKLQSLDGQVATDFFVYVDDVRTTGFASKTCWACTRKVASTYNSFGIQDAPQKQRGLSSDAGPWTGSTVITSGGAVYINATLEWWTKAKMQIDSGPNTGWRTSMPQNP